MCPVCPIDVLLWSRIHIPKRQAVTFFDFSIHSCGRSKCSQAGTWLRFVNAFAGAKVTKQTNKSKFKEIN